MIKLILLSYLLLFITWILYLTAMNLIPRMKQMHWVAKLHAYPLIFCAVCFDAFINIFIASLIFLDHPREWLLTKRLQRYLYEACEDSWRETVAAWICHNLLDQFDTRGKHC